MIAAAIFFYRGKKYSLPWRSLHKFDTPSAEQIYYKMMKKMEENGHKKKTDFSAYWGLSD